MEDAELDILEPGLWGAHVTQGNPVPLKSGELRLTISRATLEKGGRAQLFLSIKGTKYALGTLIKDKKEYTKLSIDIFEGTEEDYEFSVVGDGTVALIGSHSPPLFDQDEDEFGSLSDLEDSDEDEDAEAYIAALKAAGQPKAPGKAQLPAAQQQGAKPAAQKPQQKGQQNQQKGQQNQQKGQQNQQKGQQNQQKGQQKKVTQEAAKPPETKAETPETKAETGETPAEMEEVKSESSQPATPSPGQAKGKGAQKKGGQNQQKKSPAAGTKPTNTPKAGNPKSPAAGGNQAKRANTPNPQGNAQKKQKK